MRLPLLIAALCSIVLTMNSSASTTVSQITRPPLARIGNHEQPYTGIYFPSSKREIVKQLEDSGLFYGVYSNTAKKHESGNKNHRHRRRRYYLARENINVDDPNYNQYGQYGSLIGPLESQNIIINE